MSQNLLKETQPLYEIGLGAIGLNTPDYPGSSRNRSRVIPFPWVIYRGKIIRVDDEGNRARIFSSARHEIGVQPSFSFPVRSNDNPERQGLPNLDYLLGLGPRVLFRLISQHPSHLLNLSLSVIGHYATNFSSRFHFQGLSFNASLSHWYDWKKELTLFSRFNLQFGSVEHNSYFYGVRSSEVTPERSAYRAKAGLTKTSLSLGGGTRYFKNLFIFSSLSWHNLALAQNKRSPLMARSSNVSFIVGFTWTFWESKKMVPRPSLKEKRR